MIADCAPAHLVPPAGPLTLAHLEDYTLALEDALVDCRRRMRLLREQEARR